MPGYESVSVNLFTRVRSAVSCRYFVQLGIFGQVGRLAAVGPAFDRGDRVVCRTARGMELGRILATEESDAGTSAASESDGEVLRRMTETDQLLQARIESHRDRALYACERALDARGIDVGLIDVEHLFDGGSLYFYFLGAEDPRLAEVTAELAEAYETKVNFRRFAERLATGCGPGCGTAEKAGGCGSGGCSSCGLTGGCAVREAKTSS